VACGGPVLESAKSYHFFNRSDFPERYQERIGSSKWKELRLKVIERRGGCCQRCGSESRDLELHHLHYRSLGSEALEDVELLCQSCHVRADEARVSRRRPKREISDEGWIVGPDGDEYWGKFDRDTIYVPLGDGRYVPVISKAKR
jgi:5-methylcytosine-specific restriction endonuclease McrA